MKKIFLFFIFIYVLVTTTNLLFPFFKSRIQIIAYNQYDENLINWPAKVTFPFNLLNIKSCDQIDYNNTLLVDETNTILPYRIYCSNSSKEVILSFLLNNMYKHQNKRIFFYINGQNKIEIVKNPIKIEYSTYFDEGNSICKYNLSFPLPNLKYYFNNISLLGYINNLVPYFTISFKVDNCKVETSYSNVNDKVKVNINELQHCINKHIINKESNVTIKVTIYGCNVNNYRNILKDTKLVFRYPSPIKFGLNIFNNKFNNEFIYGELNGNITLTGIKEEVEILKKNLKFYIAERDDTSKLITNNIDIGNLGNVKNPSEVSRIFYIKEKENPLYSSVFYLKGFDSWFNYLILFNNYYKFKTRISIKNTNFDDDGNLIYYHSSYLNVTINKHYIPTYYKDCSDIKIFANYTEQNSYEEVPFKVTYHDNDICKLKLFIKELNKKLDLDIYHYNPFDFLQDNKQLPTFNFENYITNFQVSYYSPFYSNNLFSKVKFNFSVIFRYSNKLCVFYENQKNPYCVNNLELGNKDTQLLKALYISNTKYKDIFLVNFNHFIGEYKSDYLKKGVKNMEIKINKKANSYLVNIQANNSPIHTFLISAAYLNNNEDIDLNSKINFDIENAFKISEYLKQPFALFLNNLNKLKYLSTVSSVREYNNLFYVYIDFNNKLFDLRKDEIYLRLHENFNLYGHFELFNKSLIIYPNINENGLGTKRSYLSTKKQFKDVSMFLAVKPLTKDSKLFVSKSNGRLLIKFPNVDYYLVIINFGKDKIAYNLYNLYSLKKESSGSVSFNNDLSSIKVGVDSSSILNNNKLNGVILFSIGIFNYTPFYSPFPLNYNPTSKGFSLYVPEKGMYISRIPEGVYESKDAEYCYLDKFFRCTDKITNLIFLKAKKSGNIYFNYSKNAINLNYIYNLIKPKYYLIPNTKGEEISAENAVLGIPEFNILWRNKNSYLFFGTNYPITTRKGLIKWKIIRGLHIYTPFVLYQLIDYPFVSYFVSNLEYQLKNEEIEIIK